MVDKKQGDKEVDKKVCRVLQNKENYIRECNRVGVTDVNEKINVSRIVMYQKQVEEQKKILPSPVEINKEKEYKVEKILNRKDMRGKIKYLVK